jgi:hypothetical protein
MKAAGSTTTGASKFMDLSSATTRDNSGVALCDEKFRIERGTVPC